MVYLLKIGGSFHGYVSHNQMVILIQMCLSKTIAVLRFVGALGHCPSVSPFTLQFAPRHGWFLDTKIRMVMAAFPGFKAIVIPECFFITRQLKNHKQWNLGEFQHPHINYWVSLEQCWHERHDYPITHNLSTIISGEMSWNNRTTSYPQLTMNDIDHHC